MTVFAIKKNSSLNSVTTNTLNGNSDVIITKPDKGVK